MIVRCPNDDGFGPALDPARDCYSFDFTLVFEDAFFSIAPCGVAVLLAAWRFYALAQREDLVRWPVVRALKLVTFGILAAFHLALAALWGSGYGVRVRTTLAASIFTLFTTLILLAQSDFEHRRSVRPAGTLQVFFFFTILLDLPRIRTQWLLDENAIIASLLTVAFAIRIALIFIESIQKFTHTSLPPEAIAPEDRQGVFGRTFFTWLNPMFLEGYSRDLTMDDMVAIDDSLKGEALYARLLKQWKAANHKNKHCLTSASLKTFFPELVTAFIPRTALMALTFAQPYLVNASIRYISGGPSLPKEYGYGLIAAYFLTYFMQGLCTRWYMHVSFRTMTKVRGALVTIIYRNMITIRAENANSSAALSLMSTDVDRITFTTFNIVDLAPSVIQFGIVLGLLATELGASCIAPVILCIICGILAAQIGKLVPPRQRKWMAAIQKRVGITADVIGAMKGVKVAGLSEKAEMQIEELRNYELVRSTSFRRMQVCNMLLGIVPALLMPAVTFTVYAIVQQVSGSGQFGVAQAFTSLSLLNVLLMPVMSLTNAWTNLASGLACLDRIQAFLLREKRDDYRTLMALPDAASSTRDSTSPIDEASEKFDNPEKPIIKVRGATFGWKGDAKPDGPPPKMGPGGPRGPPKDGMKGSGGPPAKPKKKKVSDDPAEKGELPDRPIVKDVDMDVMPGELTLIVGPVASGKTTLLKGLLGEARMFAGSVEFTIPEHIAYCDQDAWLLNRTVKENIVAYEPYDDDLYNTVIRACQLEEDISVLPKQHDTLIGSKGVSLSGGQKQRVALARAVYNRKPIIVLDDILKGLDADTYSKCFAATIGPEGMLRQNRTAIILATHNIQLLPYADNIVVLNTEGHVTERGSFESLNSANGYVNSLGLKKGDLRKAAEADAESIEQELLEKEAIIAKITSAQPTQEEDKKKTMSRGKRNKDSLITYVRSMGNTWFGIFCFFTVANVGFRSAQSLWLNVWTSANEVDSNANVGYYVGIYVMFGILNVVFMFAEFWTFLIIILPHSAKLLHKKVLHAAMHAPLSYFVATDTGEIVNRFSQDMTLVDMQLPMSFMMCYGQVIGGISQIILTCVASGYLAIVIPVLFGALYVLQKFYLRTSRQIRLLDLEAKSPLYSDFIASFAGLTALRAYGWTKDAEDENLRRLNDSQRPYYLLFCVQRWLILALNLMVAGLATLLIGIAVALRDKISPGLLGVALTSVMGVGMTLSMLITSWTQLETSLGAITRINEFERDTPREMDGPDMPPAQWPAKGSINVNGLYAKYGDRTVLTDINLHIEPGQKIAVCGRSGSGKSTLIMLLLRLYQPAQGSIDIDGIDTSTLNLNALRDSVVSLPQDPMFLAGTVRYNLDPLGNSSDEELLIALEKMNIKAAIEEKGGLDAELDTDWLSAGQRQLFCLARAILRKSKILLLDEATSSLDRETEALVDELIRKEFSDWTAVVVAHRLKTVADFDKVLVLQDGKVMEYDSPGSLLSRDSLFKNLWDLQES